MRGQMTSGLNVHLGDYHEGVLVKEEGGVLALNYCLIYYVIIACTLENVGQ